MKLASGSVTFGLQRSPFDDSALSIPPLIRDYLDSLDRGSDLVTDLRAIRGIAHWLRELEDATIASAREAGMTWEEIGAAQERPRQNVHRQANSKTPYRPLIRGLTSPEFDHVGTPDIRYWLRWWAAPERSADGPDEKGRDPVAEQRKLRAEIEAREQLGVAGPYRSRAW